MTASAAAGSVSDWRHARAIILLPVMNTIVIPMLIAIATPQAELARIASVSIVAPGAGRAAAAALATIVLLLGLVLVTRAIALFRREGRGTLAPWDPTRELIVGDLYRYMRNPMKTGLFLILVGESVLLHSWPHAIWAGVFILINAVYIRISEESGLRARFGRSYGEYCAAVPRWWPRLTPAPRLFAGNVDANASGLGRS